MAPELPFDTLAGPTYDAIDILMPPEERAANQNALKLWFVLLDHGYHIAASGSSDATFDRPGGGVPGKVRIYTHLNGSVDLARVATAIKTGHSFVSTGPLITLEIGGHESGDTIPLPSPPLKGHIRAWADRITRIELFRNGAVFRTFTAPAEFEIAEQERAWYVARVYGADDMQVAVTNPIWFEPRSFQTPQPVRANVKATVVDAATGKHLDGTCAVVRMVGTEAVTDASTSFRSGAFAIDAPAAARIRVEVPGYKPVTKSIFMDFAPVRDLTLNLRLEQLTDWTTFEQISGLLKKVTLQFRMEPDRY